MMMKEPTGNRLRPVDEVGIIFWRTVLPFIFLLAVSLCGFTKPRYEISVVVGLILDIFHDPISDSPREERLHNGVRSCGSSHDLVLALLHKNDKHEENNRCTNKDRAQNHRKNDCASVVIFVAKLRRWVKVQNIVCRGEQSRIP